jgi:hypothetical protein
MRSEDGYGVPEERYSAECVEGVFREVCLVRLAAKITHLSDAPGADAC